MKTLSLFSGAGGGLIGETFLGWEHIGYVEYDNFCQQVIRARIRSKDLPNAPIFGDIRTFLSEGYADSYKGVADCVTAGFPCQPFSLAGKRRGDDDDRNMWPSTREVLSRVQSPFCLLENVPGLLSASVGNGSERPVHYFGTILRDLAEIGYDVRWTVLGADDVLAPHKRKRLWLRGDRKA